MGIRGLTKFVSDNITKFSSKPRGISIPVIVDGNALKHFTYHHLDKSSPDSCDIAVYEYLYDFFMKLNHLKINVNCILFDGMIVESKFNTILSRSKDTMKESIKYFNQFDGQKSPTTFACNFQKVILQLSTASPFNFEVIVSSDDADKQIATYANKNKCYVISEDSDYYIYNIPGYIQLSSISKLINRKNLERQSVYAYNSRLFAKYYNIHPWSLPLFGALAGTDTYKCCFPRQQSCNNLSTILEIMSEYQDDDDELYKHIFHTENIAIKDIENDLLKGKEEFSISKYDYIYPNCIIPMAYIGDKQKETILELIKNPYCSRILEYMKTGVIPSKFTHFIFHGILNFSIPRLEDQVHTLETINFIEVLCNKMIKQYMKTYRPKYQFFSLNTINDIILDETNIIRIDRCLNDMSINYMNINSSINEMTTLLGIETFITDTNSYIYTHIIDVNAVLALLFLYKKQPQYNRNYFISVLTAIFSEHDHDNNRGYSPNHHENTSSEVIYEPEIKNFVHPPQSIDKSLLIFYQDYQYILSCITILSSYFYCFKETRQSICFDYVSQIYYSIQRGIYESHSSYLKSKSEYNSIMKKITISSSSSSSRLYSTRASPSSSSISSSTASSIPSTRASPSVSMPRYVYSPPQYSSSTESYSQYYPSPESSSSSICSTM
ncbi:hypothetical protein WA158_004292 [Blastocystis sp. Blastoise]